MNNFKCKLDTGKTVILRDIKIKDKNDAAQAAALRAGGDQAAFNAMMQDEILKLLIIEIDGKQIKQSNLEDLDAHLAFSEYQQLLLQVMEMIGSGKKPAVELVKGTTGAK